MIFSIVAILLYLAAWTLLIHGVLRKEKASSHTLMMVTGAGLTCHGIALYGELFIQGGMLLGLFKITSLFFWVINGLVWFSGIKKPLHNLYLGLLPLSALAMIASMTFASSPITESNSLSAGVVSHILLSILAYSLLTMATLHAILLAYQNNKLRTKHPASVMGLLPPLQTMEALLFELVWAGMLFLTLSIITGFIFIDDFFAQKLSHKTVFSLLSWGIYATLLTGRHFIGWRGNTAIRWVLGGFTALMLAYFGSKLVLEVILHSY